MFDITNIPQKRVRSRESRDASGKLVRTKEEYWSVRPVKVVTGFERFSHYFLDLLIISALSMLLSLVMNVISSAGLPWSFAFAFQLLFNATGFLLGFGYYMFFEWKFGTTPGKMAFGKVVLMKKGTPPDAQAAFTRSLIRLIPFEAFSCFSDRGWHDQWSETYVVSKEERDAILLALADANEKAKQYREAQAGA